MRAVRNTPEERSSHANIMERQDHRKTLEFISTVEFLSRFNNLLNITVDEEHERWEKDDDRITRYDQIYKLANYQDWNIELLME